MTASAQRWVKRMLSRSDDQQDGKDEQPLLDVDVHVSHHPCARRHGLALA